MSTCQISLGDDARIPSLGFAGFIRFRGRRQPFLRASRCHVEAEAQHLGEALGQDCERSGRHVPVLIRRHHVLHHLAFLGGELLGMRLRTGRGVLEFTLFLPFPVVVSRLRQPNDTERASKREHIL